jgi:predicted negative regulator of RcsB-dependent stress response
MAVELYDEHEQGERVRKWIREYGISIVTGLVLAFGGIFGFRYWQDHQANQKVVAANLFTVIQTEVEAGRSTEAQAQFETLQAQVPRSAFVGLSALVLAAGHIDDGRLEPAARLYREVLDKRRMESLWPVARLRLARVLEAQGHLQDALGVLDGVAVPPGHKAAWAELRGDLLLGLGRRDEARLAFEQAIDAGEGGALGQRMLQMKIDATGPGAGENQS